MEWKEITEAKCKDTGLAAVLILLILTLAFKTNIYLKIAVVVLVLTMAVPKTLTYPAKAWFGLSHLMGTIVSKIVLALLFFGVITPVGIMSRMTGKDAMLLKKWKTGRGR